MNAVTKKGACGCQLYEFMGIPCKHLLPVLDRVYANEIPPHFIMKRWTKNANRTEVIGINGLLRQDDPNGVSEAARISHYCRLSTQFAFTIGKSDEAYKAAMDFLDQAIEKVRELEENQQQCEGTKKCAETRISAFDTVLLDPHISLTKGR
ncbi:zinc finger protein [Macleaya cordata]|uniref:Protein FAR1-RELATED SEQUENCE n=1 Tax=Macleaya cordata TaxID=56857 RepID=A0A200RD68_MACCD|nr:zinc finger protein [Macleaya cordata]